MRRSNRLFELIQILRAEKAPITAGDLAVRLEVSERTIYRDISALQAMRTPIEGAPGLGYVMRRGYDLPPLNFDDEEIEALRVGLSLLARTGDSALQQAADRIHSKIDALQNPALWLQVAPWGAPKDDPANGCIPIATFRQAIREARKLTLTYRDMDEVETIRMIRPIALIYHVECTMLAAWCELREGFRHFRTDRIWACDLQDDTFSGQAEALRQIWQDQSGWGVQ